MSIEAMKQALEALKSFAPHNGVFWRNLHKEDAEIANVIASLRQAIEQAEKQEPIKIDGNTSDGYHTFNELYEFRKAYNVALFNEWASGGKCSVHKSWRHHDGELCFGGGWFIVVAVLPQGQISNHYEAKDWNLFAIPEVERALFEFDGHTGNDVIERLEAYTTPLTAPVQEPVAWMTINAYGEEDDIHYENPEGHLLEGWTYKPLYTRPQPAAQMRMPKIGDRVICIEDESLATVESLTCGGSPDIKFDDGSHGTYLLREFAELFCYADITPQPQQAQKQEPWVWQQSPIKTQWGDDMVVADLAIDKDHTVSVYCERDQTARVEAMFNRGC